MVITDAGNVGINTDSPSSALEVNNASAGATVATFEGTYSGSGDVKLASFERVGGAVAAAVTYTDASTSMEFGTTTSHSLHLTTGDTPRLTIDNGGNVNIGTASATSSSKVTIQAQGANNSDETALVLRNYSAAPYAGFVTTEYEVGTTKIAEISAQRINSTNGQLIFRTNQSGTFSDALTITNSGNVLVGTTNTAAGQGNSATGISLRGGTDNRSFFSVNQNYVMHLNRKGNDGSILEFAKDGTTVGSIGTNSGYLVIGSSNNSADAYLLMGNNLIHPASSSGGGRDAIIDLGGSGSRFKDIYASNGTIQTSDRNEKQDIEDISEAETKVAVAVKGLLKKFRWKSAVEDKGDDARIHFGIIAQDLQDAFTAEGLDAGDYGMFISSTWTDETTGEEKTRLGVRYSELLAFIIAAI